MSENWPPTDYATLSEYEKNDWAITALGVILLGVFGIAAEPPLRAGTAEYMAVWAEFASLTGANAYPLLSGLGAAITLMVVLVILWNELLVPVHERIHYEVGRHLDLAPEYGTDDLLWFTNPCVTAMETGITTHENILMLVAPFFVIGIPSFVLMVVTEGLIAGVAAFVFISNSAASAQDWYHTLRIMAMPMDTLFANFEAGDEIRTEYAIPESEN